MTNRRFDSRTEEEVYLRINELNIVVPTGDTVNSIKAVRPFTRTYPYDFSIQLGSRQIGIIEVKSSVFDLEKARTQIEEFASSNDIRFAVVTNSEDFLVTDFALNTRSKVDFNGFAQQLASTVVVPELPSDELRLLVETIISEIASSGCREVLTGLDLGRKTISSSVTFDKYRGIYSFKNYQNLDSWENKFFRFLLRDGEPIDRIYRYCSLSTVFAMLNYRSFRMNCLVGMNDPSEVNYAESYITGQEQEFGLFRWQTVSAYNRRFISSCSLKEDDLTQWRLYADDSKGACLTFELVRPFNNKFIVKRVSYARPDGTHPELDLIRSIIDSLRTKLGITFRFKSLGTWRHFFKPREYVVEDEVRILHVGRMSDERKWLLTDSHNILNPFVEFKLSDPELPFRLEEIVLGPNLPFKEMNLRQFEELIREVKKAEPTIRPSVSISRIKIYR